MDSVTHKHRHKNNRVSKNQWTESAAMICEVFIGNSLKNRHIFKLMWKNKTWKEHFI